MFLDLLEREFGRRVEYEAIIAYDLGRSLDLTQEELDEFMIAVHRSEALLSIKPMQGAIDALEIWVEAGYTIEVVTGRPTVTADVSQEWLHAAGMPHSSLTFVDKYAWRDNVFSGNSAIPLHELPESGYCLAVEDSASVASRLVTIMDAPVVLIDKPWNRDEPVESEHEEGRITRCMDWEDISERFCLP